MSGPGSLQGRRVHIAGSCSPDTSAPHRTHAHDVVRELARTVLGEGAGLVVGAGKEPRPGHAASSEPSLVFDWTVLEEAAAHSMGGESRWPVAKGPPVVIATSEKSESEIPAERRALWRQLIDDGMVRIESILPGARSGALLRSRQADFGDCAVLLGGGTGVEDLADLYRARRRSVIPLHLALGASRGDGTGGAARLFQEARANPGRFLQVGAGIESSVNAKLAGLATLGVESPATEVARRIVDLLRVLRPPTAFFVRLLDPDHVDFSAVERFFRGVADPFVESLGYERFEMGRDKARHAFMNVEIFDRLHFSDLAVVDLTGLRPNCMLELGYALARGVPVVLTAREGTSLPFDPDKIPCHFWGTETAAAEGPAALRRYWDTHGGRPPLVR
jgi:hypothetical protein